MPFTDKFSVEKRDVDYFRGDSEMAQNSEHPSWLSSEYGTGESEL